MSAHHSAEWPLTGRDGELAVIATALRDAGGVLLAGPAGVGKSRLALEALSRHGNGADRWVRATGSARQVPLAAFLPLLGPVEGTDATSLLQRAAAALRADPAAVLGVDDAHQLDDISATLLHQAAAERTVRMVVTLRTGEPAPDAVTALWKDGLLTRIDLTPLSAEQTGSLVGAVLGGRLESESARRLHHWTSGNALWLRHLVPSELRSGRFNANGGTWRWEGGSPQLGSALTTLLEEHIGELAPEFAAVLELLAVGEPLEIPLLVEVAGAAPVEECLVRGLVTVTEGAASQARLAHPLYGEVLLARVGTLRVRRRRGQLLDALVDTERTGADVLRLAVLAVDSDHPPDAKLLAAGAVVASEFEDLPLAERLIGAACAAGAGFEARLMHALLKTWQFRPGAQVEYAHAGELVRTESDHVRLILCRALDLSVTGRGDEVSAMLDAAAGSPWAEVNLQAVRAYVLLAAGRLSEAEPAARQTLDAPEVLSQARALAAWSMTFVTSMSGRVGAVGHWADQAINAAVQAPETTAMQNNVRYWKVQALGLAGHTVDLHECVLEPDRTTSGSTFRAAFLSIFQAWDALVAGRVGEAAGRLVDFRPHLPGHGGGWTALLEGVLAIARGMCGDAEGAAEAVRRAREVRYPTFAFSDPMVALGGAWATAASGAVTTAITEARRAAAMAGESGQYAVEVWARQSAVGFGDRAQAPELDRLARIVEGPRAPAAAAHARALREGSVTALLDAATTFEELGLLLPAAEAAAQAAVLTRPTDPVATAVAGRATQLAASCPGARTPALIAAARPVSVTERQWEIATLAATLSNREIAERLGVSVRTVEGHVYHACVQLGLTDRIALATYAARHRR